jgi:putative ABC transport system permease protein
MFILAVKNLIQEKGRLAFGIAGIGFANFLIMFQIAMVSGTFSQITKYIHSTPVDIWALQEGLSDITSSTSFVSSSNIPKIQAISGVERVTGLFLYYTSIRIKSKISNVFLVGFDPKSGLGGPWKMHSGKLEVDDKNIIMDKGLAQSEGLKIGDTINVSGHEVRIAGLSDETSAVATRYVFVSREAVARQLNLSHVYNYLLVGCSSGADLQSVIEQINKIQGVNAYTKSQLADNTLHFWGQFLIPLLDLLVIVCFLVGAVSVGITIYTATLHKAREYGTLRAIGAGNKQVCAVVAWQVTLLAAAGLLLGVGLSRVFIHIANRWIPGMTAELNWTVIGVSILLTVGMACLSILAPIWKIVRIDPFEVFRG